MQRPERSFLSRFFKKARGVFGADVSEQPQPPVTPVEAPKPINVPKATQPVAVPQEEPIEDEVIAYTRPAVNASQFPRFVPEVQQNASGWTYGHGTLKGSDGFFLNDVALPESDAVADVIYVTEKGVVLVEDTGVPGSIFVPEQSDLWVTTVAEGRFSFDNPLRALEKKEAALHTLLSSLFSQELPIVHFISFPTGTDLSYLELETDVPILTKNYLSAALKKTLDAMPDVVSRETAEDVWRTLLPYMKK